MYLIQKIAIAYAPVGDRTVLESDTPSAQDYRPRFDYLAWIGENFRWHPDAEMALPFATRTDAENTVAAYREHWADQHSHIRIVKAPEAADFGQP